MVDGKKSSIQARGCKSTAVTLSVLRRQVVWRRLGSPRGLLRQLAAFERMCSCNRGANESSDKAFDNVVFWRQLYISSVVNVHAAMTCIDTIMDKASKQGQSLPLPEMHFPLSSSELI